MPIVDCEEVIIKILAQKFCRAQPLLYIQILYLIAHTSL